MKLALILAALVSAAAAEVFLDERFDKGKQGNVAVDYVHDVDLL